MVKNLEWEIEYLSSDLFEGGRNHVLLYGKHADTLPVLKGVYDLASKREEFICSFHDASKINSPLDFFVPILKLKYGDEYDTKIKSHVQRVFQENDVWQIFSLASFCGRDENGTSPNSKKLPVIFVDGMEELLFKFDYPDLDEGIKKRYLEMENNKFIGGYVDLPLSKGFGDHLRAMHQETPQAGCFYGTVKNVNSIEYLATLGNYSYLFYAHNFRLVWLND